MNRRRSFLFLATGLVLSATAARPQEGSAPDSVARPAHDMVRIPGGEFLMGAEGYGHHSPPHWVRIGSFFLDRHEVTNAQYLAFCQATERGLPEFWGMEEYKSGLEYPNHPVVGITWSDARAYARWQGVRLPTEAEWEYAARGGLADKKYSHGDELDPDQYAPRGRTGTAAPSPVASFPPNGFGLHDMTGNVCEWVHDWYDTKYYAESPELNPTGPADGWYKVIRGGGWHTGPGCLRVFDRNGLKANWVDFNVGFRCAKYAGQSGALRLEELIQQRGVAAALEECAAWREDLSSPYYMDETEVNDLGYRLVSAGKNAEAISVFRLNVEAFPRSSNAWDSLGEAYKTSGDREQALECYRKAVDLSPESSGSREALLQLQKER